MKWLFAKITGSSVYVYIIAVFAGLLGYIKIQALKIERQSGKITASNRKAKILKLSAKLEREIDIDKLANEKEAEKLKIENIKDLGELTDEIKHNEIGANELIFTLNGLLNHRKVSKRQDTGKVPD